MGAHEIWDVLRRQPLFLDGTATPLALDREQVERFYLPVARVVLAGIQTDRREIVAVAGPPGSGKSAFALTLAALLDVLAGKNISAVAGLDGWHYPNAWLDSHMITRHEQILAMRKIKGSPETYDMEAFTAFLEKARSGEAVAYPVYSRELHDPISEGGLLAGQRVAVVEGNYLLLDEEPWKSLTRLYDLTLFLSAGPEALLQGLRERHLRGGKPPEEAEAHIARVDIPNIERVLGHSLPGDFTLFKKDSWKIERIDPRIPRILTNNPL